jgi:hypothetical protein
MVADAGNGKGSAARPRRPLCEFGHDGRPGGTHIGLDLHACGWASDPPIAYPITSGEGDHVHVNTGSVNVRPE